MDDPGDRRTVLLRALVASLCSLFAASSAAVLSLRPLDVAVYAVLAPIAAVTVLMTAPGAVRVLRSAHRRPAAPAVAPEPSETSQPVDRMLTPPDLTPPNLTPPDLTPPNLTPPDLTMGRARGGPQALRHELTRDRADQVESKAPVV